MTRGFFADFVVSSREFSLIEVDLAQRTRRPMAGSWQERAVGECSMVDGVGVLLAQATVHRDLGAGDESIGRRSK